MFLLDTNVISELRKARVGKANAGVAAWAEAGKIEEMFISVITVQEIEIGILRKERQDSKQGALLRTWLNQHVIPTFADRILPIDLAVAQRSASLHVPNLMPFRDGLIAATALIHGMTIVTRNVADFADKNVALINPFEA